MPTFEEVMAVVALPEDTVSLCLAANLLNEIVDLQRQRDEAPPPANIGERSPAAIIEERIAEVAERMKASTVDFKLRALGGREWEPFYLARPVRKDDEGDDEWRARWFPWLAELVSRTCIDPVMTPDQVGELVDRLHGQAWSQLQSACLMVNVGQVEAPHFVNVSSQTQTFDETSKPPSGPVAAIRSGSAKSRQRSPRSNATTKAASSAA